MIIMMAIDNESNAANAACPRIRRPRNAIATPRVVIVFRGQLANGPWFHPDLQLTDSFATKPLLWVSSIAP